MHFMNFYSKWFSMIQIINLYLSLKCTKKKRITATFTDVSVNYSKSTTRTKAQLFRREPFVLLPKLRD